MSAPVRSLFWWQAAAAVSTGALALLTAVWDTWIEVLFGVDPDHGDGALEWVAVGCLLGVTVALAASARREWRRAWPART